MSISDDSQKERMGGEAALVALARTYKDSGGLKDWMRKCVDRVDAIRRDLGLSMERVAALLAEGGVRHPSGEPYGVRVLSKRFSEARAWRKRGGGSVDMRTSKIVEVARAAAAEQVLDLLQAAGGEGGESLIDRLRAALRQQRGDNLSAIRAGLDAPAQKPPAESSPWSSSKTPTAIDLSSLDNLGKKADDKPKLKIEDINPKDFWKRKQKESKNEDQS